LKPLFDKWRSNRHLLQDMFYDKKRPFYKLCDVIPLERIPAEDYEKYLHSAAKRTWQKALSSTMIEDIFSITERHPYYINKLCSLIWKGDYPTQTGIHTLWREYVLENKSVTERELELMSINQRKLLIYLAQNEATKEPYSIHFTKELELSPGSLSRAISLLTEKDYIYVDKKGYYKILDPLLRSVLAADRYR
jgi:DNA-binding transcriptional ArsR family regulator